VVFKLSRTGRETVLHTFMVTDGEDPIAGVILDAAGNLYGTTYGGGPGFSQGTVFKLSKTGKYTLLHSFTGGDDGGGPTAGVILDAEGNLYGTTFLGGGTGCGGGGCGVIFKLSRTGEETVLHSFTGTDGDSPVAGVIHDAEGNLYGITSRGGDYNYGTVFKLTP
jgi:uncharacterized repeat protein (TIGR03803 family)